MYPLKAMASRYVKKINDHNMLKTASPSVFSLAVRSEKSISYDSVNFSQEYSNS